MALDVRAREFTLSRAKFRSLSHVRLEVAGRFLFVCLSVLPRAALPLSQSAAPLPASGSRSARVHSSQNCDDDEGFGFRVAVSRRVVSCGSRRSDGWRRPVHERTGVLVQIRHDCQGMRHGRLLQ